jgi:WS/DGAT/MGAT family acyltransferase
MHLIEGLDDGGFAMFVKMHHALVDGYTGMRLLQRSLSTDPGDMESPILFAPHRPARRPTSAASDSDAAELARPSHLHRALASTRSLTTAVAQTISPVGQPHLVRQYEAPRTIFNTRIGRSRRFATQQLDLDAVRALGRELGATVNDVCLSLVGGALRTYLGELGELPTRPLIALVPVSTRPEGDPGGGNAFGAVLASLGTDIEEPRERLEAVTASMAAAKSQVAGMGQLAAVGYASLLVAPMLAQVGLAAVGAPLPGPFSFNLIVSNVPGPKEDRYFRGSRLEAMYPASLQLDAAALNITLLSYAGTLNIGFSGDRDAVPHLQRLALGLAQSWDALRSATTT